MLVGGRRKNPGTTPGYGTQRDYGAGAVRNSSYLTYHSYYGMFHTMNDKMVVTNVRMPENEWRQIRIAAAEAGMSVNEYFNYAAKTTASQTQLFGKPQKTPAKYAAMWDVLKRKTKHAPMGWSAEDEAIYSA